MYDDEHVAEIELLESLTEYEYLEQPAHGIALQVIAGQRPLSAKQQAVYQRHVADEFFHLKCRRCKGEIPTSEVIGALVESDDLCSWCRKMESNEN